MQLSKWQGHNKASRQDPTLQASDKIRDKQVDCKNASQFQDAFLAKRGGKPTSKLQECWHFKKLGRMQAKLLKC